MIIRELINRIGFDVNDKPLKDLDANLKSVKNSFLAVGAAVAAATAALGGIILSTAKAGDEFAKTSQRVGIAIGDLQRLAYVADRSGMSYGDLITATRFLNRNLAEAAKGTKLQVEAFRALGVSATDGSGKIKSTDKVTIELADAFAKLEDGALKTRLAMDIFGRSGTAIITLLNGGGAAVQELMGRADALGGVMSDDAAKASEVFLDSITDVKLAISGLSYVIGSALIPEVTAVIHGVLAWYVANKDLIKVKVKSYLDDIVKILKAFWGVLGLVLAGVNRLVSSLGGLQQVMRGVFLIFSWFIALKLIGVFSSLITIVIGLAKAIRTLGLWSLFTSGSMALIPALLAALAVAIALVIEDIIVYLQGGESAIGRFIKAFQELPPHIRDTITAIALGIAALLGALLGPAGLIASLVLALTTAGVYIYNNWDRLKGDLLMLWDDVKQGISLIIDDIVNYISKKIGGAIDWISNKASGIGRFFGLTGGAAFDVRDPAGVGGSAGFAPAPARVGGASTTNINASRNSVSAPITINPPAGASPVDIGKEVKRELEGIIANTLTDYGAI